MTPVEPLSDAGNAQLVIAALLGIAAVVLLIVWAKMHPFIALILGAAVMGGVAGVAPLDIVTSFTTGFGSTVGNVGLLIALGAMIGALLADSGGADSIVDTIIGKVGARGLPWAMALIAAILGLPLFFEVGVVLLVPVVILVARRTDVPLMRVGIPALAGLSILHGLVPPHPGPLVAIDARRRRPRPDAAARPRGRRPDARGLRAAAGPVRGELGAGARDGRGRGPGNRVEVTSDGCGRGCGRRDRAHPARRTAYDDRRSVRRSSRSPCRSS